MNREFTGSSPDVINIFQTLARSVTLKRRGKFGFKMSYLDLTSSASSTIVDLI